MDIPILEFTADLGQQDINLFLFPAQHAGKHGDTSTFQCREGIFEMPCPFILSA